MPAHPQVTPEMEAVLGQRGIAVTSGLWVRDWTGEMPPFVSDALFWVVDPASGKAAMLARLGADWRVLNDPPDREALNHGLRQAQSVEPDAEVQRTLIRLLHDPRILYCDAHFAGFPDMVLQTYVRKTGPGVGNLREYCREATFEHAGPGEWQATRRILDFSGAIRQVTMAGRRFPLSVTVFRIDVVAPPGSFYFADEY